MPIEIKELHIKINVNEGSKPAPTSNTNEKDVVEECVDQVMQIIERQKER